MTMPADSFEELWKQTVDSRAFQLAQDAQALHRAFDALLLAVGILAQPPQMGLVDRDIRLVRADIDMLVRDVSGLREMIRGIVERRRTAEKEEEAKLQAAYEAQALAEAEANLGMAEETFMNELRHLEEETEKNGQDL